MANVLEKINRLPIFAVTFAALIGLNFGLALARFAG